MEESGDAGRLSCEALALKLQGQDAVKGLSPAQER
jgi:hypothetical protein